MAAPTYVGAGSVSAVTTSAAVPYPASLAAGDLIEMVVYSDVAAIPTDQTAGGFAALGSVVTAGGISCMSWTKTATGSETGSYTLSGTITSGTKGAAWMKAFRPAASGTLVASVVTGSDTDTSSTAFSATAAALPINVDDLLSADWVMAAPSGSYSANASGIALTETGATLSTTARFGGRTGTNTLAYGSVDGPATAITAPTTPALVATGVGANAAGLVRFTKIHGVPAAATPQAVKGVINATQYGAASTIIAGLGDSVDTTGIDMSGTLSDVAILVFDDALPSTGIPRFTLKLLGNGGTATVSVRLYAADDTTAVAAAQTFSLTGTASTIQYDLTTTEATALTNRRGLRLKITQTA